MISFVRSTSLCLIVCWASQHLHAQQVRLVVTNPLQTKRTNEPVVLRWADLTGRFSRVDRSRLRLIDPLDRSIAFQVDDVDGDGKPDELAFQASLDAGASAGFMLTAERDSLAGPRGPARTDAATYKRVEGKSVPIDDDDGPGTLRSQGQYPFDGVGWESEVIGYRLYLDERNAVDIQAKRIPGLHWDFIGRTGVNYQLDAYWGMDVLHVGSSFGFGGMAVYRDGKVYKPNDLDRRRTRILARGPVRAVTLVEYTGWLAGNERVDLSSTFIMYAGDRVTEHRVLLRGGLTDCHLATGIVRHARSTAETDPDRGYVLSSGRQSRVGDQLTMLLAYSPESFVKSYQTDVDDAVVLRLTSQVPQVMHLAAIWEGEAEEGFGRNAENLKGIVLARAGRPLTVTIQ